MFLIYRYASIVKDDNDRGRLKNRIMIIQQISDVRSMCSGSSCMSGIHSTVRGTKLPQVSGPFYPLIHL